VTFTAPAWTVTVCESPTVGTGTEGSGTGTVALTGGTAVWPDTSTEEVASLCEATAGGDGGDGSVPVLSVGTVGGEVGSDGAVVPVGAGGGVGPVVVDAAVASAGRPTAELPEPGRAGARRVAAR